MLNSGDFGNKAQTIRFCDTAAAWSIFFLLYGRNTGWFAIQASLSSQNGAPLAVRAAAVLVMNTSKAYSTDAP